ncbi:MAG: hypothetical protein KIH69_016915 [Anaerolineae bacterium]|nr:hypothetical protein [Anaerolineae bacterium]
MNNINNIANKISKIAFVIALVFVAWMLIQPETVAAGTDTAPSTRRITAMSRNTIRRVATVSAVNVVSSATEPVVPTEPRNVVSPATEPVAPTNVVSSATEPTNTSKVRTTPRIQVTGSSITRK